MVVAKDDCFLRAFAGPLTPSLAAAFALRPDLDLLDGEEARDFFGS